MKKAFVLIIAGLVLCGLVFAAGCTASDPVAGEWKWQGEDGHNYYTFNNDGTGSYTQSSEYSNETTTTDEDKTTVTTNKGSWEKTEMFDWTKNENEYTAFFLEDEDQVVFIYDEAAGTLTHKENGKVLVRK